MSSTVKSHYTTRGLTRPWETSDRQLYFLDLTTKKIDKKPSRELLAIPGLHSTSTEGKLNKLFEDSFGKYRKHYDKAPGRAFVMPEDPRMVRALTCLVVLQAPRTRQALAPERATLTIDDLLADEKAANALVDRYAGDFQLIGGTLSPEEWMCFPSLGLFMLPVMGQPPAFAVPITPRTFVTLYPREADPDQLLGMVQSPYMIPAFSMANQGLEHKLIVPAKVAERVDHTALIDLLLNTRANGQRIVNLTAAAATTAGLKGYGFFPSEPRDQP